MYSLYIGEKNGKGRKCLIKLRGCSQALKLKIPGAGENTLGRIKIEGPWAHK